VNRADQARQIHNDRERIVAAGVRASAVLTRTLPAAVMLAAERRADWRAALRRGLAPMIRELADGLALAELTGRWRGRLVADRAPAFAAARGTAYESALEVMRRRLALTPAQLAAVVEATSREAAMLVGDIGGALERKVAEAIEQSTREGLHVRAGTALVREAFDDAGVTPRNSYTLEAIYRTHTGQAYEAGQWETLKDPDVAALIWGFEYASVIDGQETPICAQLDGMRLRKENPAWERLRPLNHWGCRSSLLKILFGDPRAVETPIPLVDPQEGFEFKPDVLGAVEVPPAKPT